MSAPAPLHASRLRPSIVFDAQGVSPTDAAGQPSVDHCHGGAAAAVELAPATDGGDAEELVLRELLELAAKSNNFCALADAIESEVGRPATDSACDDGSSLRTTLYRADAARVAERAAKLVAPWTTHARRKRTRASSETELKE